ncbi:hypothetical protein WISP_143566 [Willisornis vidua]|uniref:Uncharacterized protein n=1 Tax=Willisornis vidua TaxID=1566151 RepID=A0ABQ9CLF3_9PASS|nr:hypothetical protein WISP_143566 [Willisornis vidua]
MESHPAVGWSQVGFARAQIWVNIDDFNDKIQFADDIKLGRSVDLLEGRKGFTEGSEQAGSIGQCQVYEIQQGKVPAFGSQQPQGYGLGD